MAHPPAYVIRKLVAILSATALAGAAAAAPRHAQAPATGGQPAPPPAAQQPRGTTAQPQFQSGTDVVLVDVTVLDRGGRPIASLRPGDFDVSVDGRPRRVQSVRLVRSGGTAPATPPGAAEATAADTAPAAGPRRFVLVIDREHVPAGEGQQMLEAAAKFVDALPADDRLALWTSAQTTMSLDFDEGREAIERRVRLAVGTYRPSFGPWNIGRDEAIRADEGSGGGTFEIVFPPPNEDTQSFPLSLRPIIERECYKQPPNCPSQVQAQVSEVARDARDRADVALANLENLVAALAPLDGPKHVVLVTGGPVLTRETRMRIATLGARAALARVTVHALQVHDAGPGARTDQMHAAPETIDQLQSAACQLATTTGGLGLTPASGEVGFARLELELSAAYVVAFETETPDRDGKTHEIDVRVRNAGWGASVRARKTFRVDPNAPVKVAPAEAPSPAPTPTPVAAAPSAPAQPPSIPAANAPAGATKPTAAANAGTEARTTVRDAALDEVVRKTADYVAAYGPKTSVIVGIERYTQNVTIKEQDLRPRTLLAEFAIVRAGGGPGWAGYRDVIEVNGRAVTDRRDRLLSLLTTAETVGEPELRRIADESARYNVGPVIRNFNVPTTALFFLHPSLVGRFTFTRKGTKKIDGVATWELEFKETRTPTMVMKRDGTNVPCEGTVWVMPEDGTVVRTRLRLRDFANQLTMTGMERRPTDGIATPEVVAPTAPPQQAPPQPQPPSQPSQGGGAQPATPPSGQGQGQSAGRTSGGSTVPSAAPAHEGRGRPDDSLEMGPFVELESLVDIEVTYKPEAASGIWLPARMTEVYEGPITLGTRAPVLGRAVGSARYSDFKRFETSARIVGPK